MPYPTRFTVADALADVLTVVESVVGERTPQVRVARRKLTAALKEAPGTAVLDIAQGLVDTGRWPHLAVAYELIESHPGARESINARRITALGKHLRDWCSVDTFGTSVTGQAWREGRITDSVVERWTKSDDRWWRRLALVSTVPLNTKARGGTGDTARTLAICKRLLADRDDMVEKALSWALRELAKRDARAVARFVADHEGRLAARVRREVDNKLRTGLKSGATRKRRVSRP